MGKKRTLADDLAEMASAAPVAGKPSANLDMQSAHAQIWPIFGLFGILVHSDE